MKRIVIIGILGCLLMACIHEKPCSGGESLSFEMKDVPYILDSTEVTNYRPYYTFTEKLDLFLFTYEKFWATLSYDYEYCRTHPVIPVATIPDCYVYLFVANLHDPKELGWSFENETLNVVFSIVDFEEPPLLLAATGDVRLCQEEAEPVELRLFVSRLEILVENPPSWATAIDVSIRNVAKTVTTDYVLGDTTHIFKHIPLENPDDGKYRTGVNTFPTYPGRPALVNLNLSGIGTAMPIVVDDNLLHLNPGVITRISLIFGAGGDLKIVIEVDGKWEIVDGGSIII